MWKSLLRIVLFSCTFLNAESEDSEFIFDEGACQEECSHPCHSQIKRCTLEEEHLWQERANASWPGKRDDNLIDRFLHQ